MINTTFELSEQQNRETVLELLILIQSTQAAYHAIIIQQMGESKEEREKIFSNYTALIKKGKQELFEELYTMKCPVNLSELLSPQQGEV